jgi:hypothetical protein
MFIQLASVSLCSIFSMLYFGTMDEDFGTVDEAHARFFMRVVLENSSPTKLRGASLYDYAPEEAAHWKRTAVHS